MKRYSCRIAPATASAIKQSGINKSACVSVAVLHAEQHPEQVAETLYVRITNDIKEQEELQQTSLNLSEQVVQTLDTLAKKLMLSLNDTLLLVIETYLRYRKILK